MKKILTVAAATTGACALFGPIGLLCLALIALNFTPLTRCLGTVSSYPEINTQTVAQYVSQNAQVQEQLWIEDVLDTNGALYQSAPFSDGMTGRVRAGKAADDSQLRKAIVEITDTSKVRGDTINIFSFAGIGGEGAAQGDVRNGTEANLITGNMQVTIGNQLFSVGYKQSEVDKTMIGMDIRKNPRIRDGLHNLHMKRKTETIMSRMFQVAGWGSATFVPATGSNLIYPPGITNRASLKSANTVDLPTIMMAGDILPSNGAYPMDTVSDSGGSVGELFMFMAADKSLNDLESDPTLTQVLQYGWDRGQNNPIFGGGFVKVRGHGIYRWIQRDHANFDNIGSFLTPRARLSVATTNTAAQDIRGGGILTGAATDTVAQWFKCFDNGPFTPYGKVLPIAAKTDETRWIMILGSGGYSVFGYTVNNGNKITTSSQVASTVAYVHNPGDLIVQCTQNTTCIGRSLMFGQQAIVGGNGSINGSTTSPEMGRYIEQKLDMENDISVGVEGCAGYQAVKRAGDNAYPGFVVIEHALSPTAVPGAPLVT